jgi:hypothetical protein
MNELKLSFEFDKIFKHLGGLFDYKKLGRPELFEYPLNGAKDQINSLRLTNSKLPNVFINFIDSSLLNAVVSKNEYGYFIGLNTGTIFLLNDLFFRMLASPNILKEFGDISKECKTKKIYNAQITDLNLLFLAKETTEDVAPKDEIRFTLALLLSSFAIKFLIMHEYAHIIFGHVDYMGHTTNEFSWNEINYDKNTIKNIDSLFTQTCEMDADCFGVNIGMQELNIYFQNLPEVKDELKLFFKDIRVSLKLWIFSVYSMFRLFGYRDYNINDVKSYSHPPSGIRQHMIFASIYTIFEAKKERLILDSIDEVVKVFSSVEQAFEEISHQAYNHAAFKFAYSSEARKHVSLLMSNWNNVRPHLEKYATGNLAPLHKN